MDFAGDFRQIFPVIPRGTSADQINACLRKSYLWDHNQKTVLTMDSHLNFGNAVGKFATKLLTFRIRPLDHDSHKQIQ